MEASAGVGCYRKSSKPAMQDEQQIKYVIGKKKSKAGKIKPKTKMQSICLKDK